MRLARPTLLSSALLALLAVPVQDASAGTNGPHPELGRKFVVAQVSGKVFIRTPGAARSSRLTERRMIPVGTTVNATKGRVKLVGAVTRERRARGEFWEGAFIARQAREKGALIDLRLVGGDSSACDGAETASKRSRRIRRLRSKAKGRFRTRGNHSAATVRGTEWLTEDRCGSSVVETYQGEVEASAGPTTFELDSGDVFEASCDPPLGSTDPLRYCVATFSNLQETPFAVGIGTFVHTGEYTLCVDPPPPGDTGDLICRVVPFPEPPPGQSYRISVLGCIPDRGQGTYTITWTWQGQLIGVLPLEVTNPNPPGYGLCPVTPEEVAGG